MSPVSALATSLILTVPPSLFWCAALLRAFQMRAKIPRLPAEDAPPRETWPRISVITPACNEAAIVEEALSSLLDNTYPALEIVAVDDRSTDATGAVMDAMAARDPRLVAVHVTELPEGWLGKLNALAEGTKRAHGDWLLFADADVVFAPGVLARIVHFAESNELDFLTALPRVATAGLFGDLVMDAIAPTLGLYKPWEASDPKSEKYFGVGAFLMARRTVFEKTPGFAWLRLEVADDLGFALLMKSHGARCGVLHASGQIGLEWYASFSDLVKKTQKNLFAILGRFSLVRSFVIALFFALLGAFPAALSISQALPVVLTTAIGVLAMTSASITVARWGGRRLLAPLLIPFGLILTAGLVVRAAVVGKRLGGIEWRGRVYPTALLAAHQRVRV